MYFGPGVHQFLSQMYEVMMRQEERIKTLENMLQDIVQQMNELQSQKKFVVEKIDYHFEQLKVERLEGTLNIGLTADAGQSLEQLAVNGQAVSMGQNTNQTAAMYTEIQDEINRFLDEQTDGIINEFEQENQCFVGKELREFIIRDVKNQTGSRIQFYVGQHLNGDSEEAIERCKNIVIEKLKSDTTTAIKQFIGNMSKSEGDKQ
ncbi:spore germination protein GerPC [Paenibacillus alkalitolerans]|uniref:spore germination protein GerPC n=1 Tax=Paenibacillus alkalitolerans TaxID=2799335 RepID=UPI0018F5EC53|nr:spore germination protein GerPC [Paenibacillus alkalitolerans]